MSILSINHRFRSIVVLCTTVALGVSAARANAQTPTPVAAAAPVPTAKPFEAFSNSAQALRDSIVVLAKAQVGTRYKHGGTTPKGFDCSGLIKYIMAALNLDVPRTARQQATVGLEINKDTSRLLPGDVLTFGKNKQGVSHVGIYIGDNKFIHSPKPGAQVRVEDMAVPYWSSRFDGARRVLQPADAPATAAAQQ